MNPRLRIGSRPSPLALVQAQGIKRAIEESVQGIEIVIVPISTTGDKLASASLARIGGKGLFVRELEQALIERRIDLAVHSLKDLPAVMPEQFRLAAVPKREDARDALLVRGPIAGAARQSPWQALKPGARVGTSSARRQFELLRQRPDVRIEPLRGNVDTRLKRLADGDFDAIMLAIAGLKRLGRLDPPDGITLAALDEREFVPSGGQAALAIETLHAGAGGGIAGLGNAAELSGAAEVHDAIAALDDRPTRAEVTAERAFLATIGASCVSPVGVKGSFSDGHLTLRALLFSVDGRRHLVEMHEAAMAAEHPAMAALAQQCGATLGRRMIAAGASALISDS